MSFARLSRDKIERYIEQINDLLEKTKRKLADMRTLIGRLNWAASLIH